MREPAMVGIAAVMVCAAGCGHGGDAARDHPGPPSTPPGAVSASPGRTSLPAEERAWALKIARHQQHRITGTLIGATAFLSPGTPYNRGSACDSVSRVLYVRLAWESDANFTHNHPPSDPPDGPRKAILITADATNGHVCQVGADYRPVGAVPEETLLFGRSPTSTDE